MTFRGIWVIDVEHRVVLFSRRFPNVERRYVSYLSQAEGGGGNVASPADTTSTASPPARVPTSIQGISDTLLMDALLSHISQESDGDASASGTTLARMKLGPFLSPIPILGDTTKGHQGADLASTCTATAASCVVGPWVVSEGRRGVVHVVAQPGTKPAKSTGSKRGTSALGTHSGSSPTLSTSSLPSVPQLPQLVVYDHPDDVVIAESNPTHTYKQNILVVALPLCSVPSVQSSLWAASPIEDPSSYLSDVRMLMAWEAVRCSLQPFVDHVLLVAPPLPNRPASQQSDSAPLMLQPHGMVVTPSAKRDSKVPHVQDAPPSWVDPKVGTHLLHVVGGWSTRTTLRRVISTFHWAQALHTLLATALPFGTITALLPQHTGTLTLGTTMQVRAEQRVDASLKNIMSPSMEPEALFQSAESGDRKMRCSEMLVVDALHLNERGTPPESHDDTGGQYGSSRSDDYGTSQRQRVVSSRAMRLLKDCDHKASKSNPNTTTASVGSPRRLWNSVLTNGACIGVSLVCEVAAQCFGQPATTSTATNASNGVPQGDAYHCMYRLQAVPPQSPNLHWLQRVEELTEAVEEAGIAAVVAEDVFPIAVAIPSAWRLSHPAGTQHDAATPVAEGMQLHVAFDETLVSSMETHCDAAPQPLASLKALAGSRGGAATKHKDKGSAAAVSAATQALLDDPTAVVNQGLDAVCRAWAGAGQSLAVAASTTTPLTGRKPANASGGGTTCDVVLLNTQGLHLWAYQRTSAIPRPEECLHMPTDLAHVTPPLPVMRSSQPIVKGVYALTPVANPYDVHKLLSASFGCDETSVGEVLTPDERAEAQRVGKEYPTDDDVESRAWIEGLLESPGNVLYHLDLDLVLPVAAAGRGGPDGRDASTKTSSSGGDGLGFVEVLAFNVVLRFLEDVSVVSLHTLDATAYDEHGVRLYSASSDAVAAVDSAAGFEQGVSASDGRPPLQQLAADTVLWQTPIQGRVVRCGSRIRLDALVVLDLRSRSGAHELQSVLTTKHHMHPTEWRQLTTVISSAQLDFVFRTHDPALTGGVQLMDPGVCAATFPGIARSLELKASSMRSDLSSLHEAVHVGGPEDVLSIVREAPSARAASLKRPPVAAPMLVRSSPASGYVLWNFAPGE